MPRTQTERLWVVGAALVALIMAAVGYFLLIGPERSRAASVRRDASDTSFQTATLQSRIASLTAQSKQLTTYRAALAKAQRALPTADDRTATPQLIRDLASTASATSTAITSLTVGQPTALTPSTPATPTASSPSSSGSTSAGTAAPATPTSTLSSIAVGATVSGVPAALNSFLSAVQTTGSRALLVTSVTLSKTTGRLTTMTLTMTAFVRPAE
ncbi:hypothetical protein [uncultured Jatrophihabitans sp.]|uniref:hypothetical protein n=1 Tax=uncultured Jatrophihabitans sp. TaxID=1610747 RepID=UPI0035CA805C